MRVSINELASAIAERKRDWTYGTRRKKGRGDDGEPPPPPPPHPSRYLFTRTKYFSQHCATLNLSREYQPNYTYAKSNRRTLLSMAAI
jgi:hypothetical protein